ncbi:MAG: hypothetical protein F6J93_00375 [Oscillatoria sp. SIO1A7]|nr:hypothetical protein [Oscillatoria sp. SIO1A7]
MLSAIAVSGQRSAVSGQRQSLPILSKRRVLIPVLTLIHSANIKSGRSL